jgi:hypothetical protein
MSGPFFKVGEIWREENKHNLQICHVAASTPRVNQGVQPWVSQRPLAKLAGCGKTRSKASVERVLRIVVEVWCQASCLAGVLIKMMLTMRIQHRTRHGAVAVVPHPTAL